MKNKNTIIILLAAIFILSFTLPSAWAGSPQQYRWEGVAIGVGAAILGSALLYDHTYGPSRVRVVYGYSYPPPRVYYPPLRVIYRRPCPPPRVIYRRPCPPRYRYYPPPGHYRHWKYKKHRYSRHNRAWDHGSYRRYGR